MLHVILKYPEVVSNLDLIKLVTIPLEFWGSIEAKYDIQTEYDAYVGPYIGGFKNRIHLDDWITINPNQNIILNDMKLSKNSQWIKITQLNLRPPELRSLFNNLGEYYQWFVVSNKETKLETPPDTINSVLSQ